MVELRNLFKAKKKAKLKDSSLKQQHLKYYVQTKARGPLQENKILRKQISAFTKLMTSKNRPPDMM